MFSATGWAYYGLTRELFGPRAAVIGLFALNVTPFFFASAGSWIVPDGPLLLALAIAALAAARLFFMNPAENASAWRLWLFGRSGPGSGGTVEIHRRHERRGLAGFVLISPGQRRWLKHPAPYVAAILALAILAPVILWNARHGWASSNFRARAALREASCGRPSFAMALGEVAFLSPWILLPLVATLVAALRHWRDERRMFLLCLGLPPIVLFTVTPLWGGRGFPHWAMPGWFFTYALIGAWLNESGVSVGALRRWALLSSALLAAIAGVAVVQASTGWPLLALTAAWNLPIQRWKPMNGAIAQGADL